MHYQRAKEERYFFRRWVMTVAVICLLSSLGCSLARQIVKPEGLTTRLQAVADATRRRLPTLTPTIYHSPTPLSTFTPLATPAPTDPAMPPSPPPPTNTRRPPPTAMNTPLPTNIPSPTSTFTPVPPTATPTPTFTPEPNYDYQSGTTPIPVQIPGPTPTTLQTPAGIPTASPTATPVTPTSGWSFVSVRITTDQDEEGVIIYGDLVNNTGFSQEIIYLTGTFYDDQGRVIADQGDTDDYWPLEVVPPGGQMPFELIVFDIQSVADFNLDVISRPSSETPRQDFEFSDIDPSNEAGDYCLAGRLRNPGDQLLDYLLIVAVLYNDQDNVINFDTYDEPSPEDVKGDGISDLEVCVDALDQQIARYELRAVGL